jgi:hypothetical protein
VPDALQTNRPPRAVRPGSNPQPQPQSTEPWCTPCGEQNQQAISSGWLAISLTVVTTDSSADD